MIWPVDGKSQAQMQIFQEIDTYTDRAAAIIGGAVVEFYLKQIIEFTTQKHELINNRLFHPSGPLGSFSSKINLAYMLKIVSLEAHDELIIIKDIRNKFAHNLEIVDFASCSPRDKAKNLNHFVQFIENLDNPTPETKNTIFGVSKLDEKLAIAKERYMLAVQVYATAVLDTMCL